MLKAFNSLVQEVLDLDWELESCQWYKPSWYNIKK